MEINIITRVLAIFAGVLMVGCANRPLFQGVGVYVYNGRREIGDVFTEINPAVFDQKSGISSESINEWLVKNDINWHSTYATYAPSPRRVEFKNGVIYIYKNFLLAEWDNNSKVAKMDEEKINKLVGILENFKIAPNESLHRTEN